MNMIDFAKEKIENSNVKDKLKVFGVYFELYMASLSSLGEVNQNMLNIFNDMMGTVLLISVNQKYKDISSFMNSLIDNIVASPIYYVGSVSESIEYIKNETGEILKDVKNISKSVEKLNTDYDISVAIYVVIRSFINSLELTMSSSLIPDDIKNEIVKNLYKKMDTCVDSTDIVKIFTHLSDSVSDYINLLILKKEIDFSSLIKNYIFLTEEEQVAASLIFKYYISLRDRSDALSNNVIPELSCLLNSSFNYAEEVLCLMLMKTESDEYTPKIQS